MNMKETQLINKILNQKREKKVLLGSMGRVFLRWPSY